LVADQDARIRGIEKGRDRDGVIFNHLRVLGQM
jgi:hypothetical protein